MRLTFENQLDLYWNDGLTPETIIANWDNSQVALFMLGKADLQRNANAGVAELKFILYQPDETDFGQLHLVLFPTIVDGDVVTHPEVVQNDIVNMLLGGALKVKDSTNGLRAQEQTIEFYPAMWTITVPIQNFIVNTINSYFYGDYES